MMNTNRANSKQSYASRPIGRFFASLVAVWAAPYGFGSGLWKRRDERWRQPRVARLFAGFASTFLAWMIAPLGVGPGFWARRGERWKHNRLQGLMDGYLRALVRWALEPYRPGLFDSLDDAQWARRGRRLGVIGAISAFFAWALTPVGFRQLLGLNARYGVRRLMGGMAMTMVAATAMAFGSGPDFADHRDEAERPIVAASNDDQGSGAFTPADLPIEQEGEAEGQAPATGDGISGTPQFNLPPPNQPGPPSDGPSGGPENNLMVLADFAAGQAGGGSGGSGGDGGAAGGGEGGQGGGDAPGDPGVTPPTGEGGGDGGDEGGGGFGLGGGGSGGSGGGAGGGGGGGSPTGGPNGGDPPSGPGDGGLIPVDFNGGLNGDPNGPNGGGDGGELCLLSDELCLPSVGGGGGPPVSDLIVFDPDTFDGPDTNDEPRGGGPTVPSFAADTAPAPAPEPATWAMMLMGFFGLGGLVRAQRRKAQATAA